MICFSRKGFYEMLRLAATRAAQGFALSRLGRRGRRYGWSPLFLRWARRRTGPAALLIKPAERPSLVSHVQQFHFHHISSVAGSRQIAPARGAFRSVSSQQARPRVDHRWTNVTAATLSTAGITINTAYEIHRRNEGAARHSKKLSSQLPLRRPQLGPISQHVAADRRPPSVLERIEDHPGRALTKETTVFRSLWKESRHQYQLLPARRAKSQHSIATGAASGKSTSFWTERPEALVWRRTPAAGRNAGDDQMDVAERTGPAGVSQQRARVLPGQATEETPVFSEPAGQMPSPAKLDPSVLDRLTNKVIQQVEKRIRIERERRGL